jgi:hypothetical protein
MRRPTSATALGWSRSPGWVWTGAGRDTIPFLICLHVGTEITARAVVDAFGTWTTAAVGARFRVTEGRRPHRGSVHRLAAEPAVDGAAPEVPDPARERGSS